MVWPSGEEGETRKNRLQPLIIRDLQIGLRVRDRVRVRFSNFKPVKFKEPLFFMLVLGRASSSRNEMGLCCDNVQPENWN